MATATSTTGMSLSAARHLAASATNRRQWILAVKQPTGSPSSASFPSLALDSSDDFNSRRQDSDSRGGNLADENKHHKTAPRPSLEDRISLPELKTIMKAFRVSLPLTTAAAVTAKTGTSLQSLSAMPDFAEASAGDPTAQAVKKLSITLAGLIDAELNAPVPSTIHPEVSTLDHDCAFAAAILPLSEEPPGGKAAATVATTLSLASPSPTPAIALRVLSRGDFTQALLRAVPSATTAEVRALLERVISETQSTVSWNELATFLVTRSRQKTDLAQEDQRLVLAGQPCNLHVDEQHSEPITCVAVDVPRRLLVTGCSTGTVRAWSSGSDLAYRGLLLKVDGWIVGLHWGCRVRALYVVTMDRTVYVLDGATFRVLRVFHGRGIDGTPVSVTYAAETMPQVQVGGVAPPKRIGGAFGLRGGSTVPSRAKTAGASSSGTSHGSFQSASSNRTTCARSGGRSKKESDEERMQRLLTSALQVRRAMRLPSSSTGAANTSATTTPQCGVEGSTSSTATAVPLTPTSTTSVLATSYSLSTANAAEALHQDSTPLTGVGCGPYVHQHVEEGVLASLVDAVTATTFHVSSLEEDVLLLGTSNGDVFLFALAYQHELVPQRVLLPLHIFTHLHKAPITKLELLLTLDALVSAGEDGRVRVTSLVAGHAIRSFYAPNLPQQHSCVTDFALHPQLKMLATVGPERQALLWDWTQASPIAVLDPVNRPLCCCVFAGEQLLTVSRDRVLHVYGGKNFRLQQEFSLAETGSLSRFGSGVAATSDLAMASASSAAPFVRIQLYVDGARQRLLGFERFPFALRVKRQISALCPARYRGHNASMLTTCASRAFGQLVTVGSDGVTMTWSARTGHNEFSFPLSNFSNSSVIVGTAIPPAVASLDVLERRLLTGFRDGVMVVWNVLSGQAERVLMAAPRQGTTSSVHAGPAASRTGSRGVGSSGSSGREAPKTSRRLGRAAPQPPEKAVTAVGSFLRDGIVSYLFAVGPTLYVDNAATGRANHATRERDSGPEWGECASTPPSSWRLPSVYGDFTCLFQLDPLHIACGTTAGAVLMYNVLLDQQEGAPLWVPESMLYPIWPPAAPSLAGTAAQPWSGGEDGNAASSLTHTAHCHPCPPKQNVHTAATATAAEPTENDADDVLRGRVAARTVKMLALPSVHPRLLVVAQEDGTLSCWHTLRRDCLGAVQLCAAKAEREGTIDGAAEGAATERDGVPTRRDEDADTAIVFDMDRESGRLLVFGDKEGNVHVCRASWQVVTDTSEHDAIMALPNPVLYSRPALSKSLLQTRASLVSHGAWDGNGRGSVTQEREPGTPTLLMATDFDAVQRTLPLLQRLERVHVFATGLPLSSLCLVDADAATESRKEASTVSSPDEAAHSRGNTASVPQTLFRDTEEQDQPKSTAGGTLRRLFVACTGTDHYIRLFTLSGVPVGEFGMDEWDVADASTFRFLGDRTDPPAVPLPCHIRGNSTWQDDSDDSIQRSRCHFDYLADLRDTHDAHSVRLGGFIRPGTPRSTSVLAASVSTRTNLPAGEMERAGPPVRPDPSDTRAVRRLLTLAAGTAGTAATTNSAAAATTIAAASNTSAALSVARPKHPELWLEEKLPSARLSSVPFSLGPHTLTRKTDSKANANGTRFPAPSRPATASRCLSTRLRQGMHSHRPHTRGGQGVLRSDAVMGPLLRPGTSPGRLQNAMPNAAKLAATLHLSKNVKPLDVEKEWSVTSSSSRNDGSPPAQRSPTTSTLCLVVRPSPRSRGAVAATDTVSRRGSNRSTCQGHRSSSTAADPTQILFNPARDRSQPDASQVAQAHEQKSTRQSSTAARPDAHFLSDTDCSSSPTVVSRHGLALAATVHLRGSTNTSPGPSHRARFPAVSPSASQQQQHQQQQQTLDLASSRSFFPSTVPQPSRSQGSVAALDSSYITTAATAATPVARMASVNVPSSRAVPQGLSSVNLETDLRQDERSSDATVLGFLAVERNRLLASTRTTALRDQLASAAVASGAASASWANPAEAPGGVGAVVAAFISPCADAECTGATAAAHGATGSRDMHAHIDAVLEKHRLRQAGSCGGVAGMRAAGTIGRAPKSASTYMMDLTSRMYAPPVTEPATPSHLSRARKRKTASD